MTTAIKEKFERVIVVTVNANGGDWGVGETEEIAKSKISKRELRRAHHVNVCRFVSDLPFAPADRPANENEADAWVTRHGGLCYIRCEQIFE
tara:strand:- start:2908 stop:3183 length:276 start_codon:yes stop_codon:yes gene_type:complete